MSRPALKSPWFTLPGRDILVAGMLTAVLVAVLASFASLGVDPHHDGIMLKPALDVLSGQVLFRDTFTQYGALTTYLQVAALWLQPSLQSLRFMTVAAYAVTLFILYATWRQILPRSLAVLSGGLFILFIPAYEKDWLGHYWTLLPWSSVLAMMFQSVTLYALFRVIRGEQPARWGLVLGLACASVFWCRQPVGVITTGCLVVIWLALLWTNWTPVNQSKRPIVLGFFTGFLAVHVLLLGGIMISGALPEWWYQNIVWPRKWMLDGVKVKWHVFTTIFVHPAAAAGLLLLFLATAAPGLVKRFRPNLTGRQIAGYFLCLGAVLVWQHDWMLRVLALREGGWTVLLPLAVLAQAVLSVAPVFVARATPKTTEYYLCAALAALALGSLLQYYPVPDSWHILWSLAPAFGLCVHVCWRWLGWPAPVLAVVLSAALLPALYAKARLASECLTQPRVTLTAPAVLRGMQVTPELASFYGRIMAVLDPVLKHQPDLPAALIGNDALFLCFTNNRENPTPYYVTWLRLADNADNLKRWSYIQRVRPLMFLHGARWEAVDDFYRRARYLPLLYLPEEALEIAVPQELAEALGLKVYGAAVEGGTTKPATQP